jgi:hypothetical protein
MLAASVMIEPAVKFAEGVLIGALGYVVILVGLVTAATLVINFFNKHAKSGGGQSTRDYDGHNYHDDYGSN